MKKTILCVDDEPGVLAFLHQLLMEEGYDTLRAQSGPEALKFLEVGRVDLVMLDIKMPGMDGMEVMDVIHSKYPQLPVLALTALHSDYVFMKLRKSGCAGLIEKPCSVEQLTRIVRSTLRRFQWHTEFQQPLVTETSLRLRTPGVPRNATVGNGSPTPSSETPKSQAS